MYIPIAVLSLIGGFILGVMWMIVIAIVLSKRQKGDKK